MINTYYQVPAVYYKESRDFQVLGRIYDVIFNYLKTSIDSIYHNPLDKSIDKNLLDLLSCTLGFEIRHNYDINQLYAICSTFSKILRNKGTLYAVRLAIDTLLNAEGINKEPQVVISSSDPYNINIFIPSKLVDTTLLEDLLDYIIPAGMSYTLVSSVNIEPDESITSTYVRAGVSSTEKTLRSATPKVEEGNNPINYIPQYENIGNNYDNLIGPGMIDNITVTMIEPDEGE